MTGDNGWLEVFRRPMWLAEPDALSRQYRGFSLLVTTTTDEPPFQYRWRASSLRTDILGIYSGLPLATAQEAKEAAVAFVDAVLERMKHQRKESEKDDNGG